MGVVVWYKMDQHGEKNESLKVHVMGSICRAFSLKCQDKEQKDNLKPDDEGPALRYLQPSKNLHNKNWHILNKIHHL